MEIWKDIPSYEGVYQVSNLGKVKSLERKVKNKDGLRTVRERVLKPRTDVYGYDVVSLSVEQKIKNRTIHLLVASAFLNHKSDGTTRNVVDHINNIKTDNRLSNLQIISHRDNCVKNKKKGTSRFVGVSYHKAKNLYRAGINIYPDVIFLGSSKSDQEYCSKLYQMALKEMDKYDGCRLTFRNYIQAKVRDLA